MAIPLNRSIEIGNHKLLSKKEFSELETKNITGDETVLSNPLFDQLFDKINDLHKPKSKIAFLGLCTYSRPYNTSPKWKKYLNDIEGIDFIVTSNGGIIPEEYWEENIFLTYHAPARGSFAEKLSRDESTKNGFIDDNELDPLYFEGNPPQLTKLEVDNLYKNKLYNRLINFFIKNKYDYVFGDFVVHQRNFEPFISAMSFLKDRGIIKEFNYPRIDIPYREDGRNYPTLEEPYYSEMIQKLEEFKGKI